MKHSATGIVRQADRIRSVTLRRHALRIELTDHQTVSADEHALCPTDPDPVIAADAGLVAFHRLTLPPVRDDELPTLINMQAEALTPLALDDMTLAWHAPPAVDGQRIVNLATARTDHLRNLIRRHEYLRPQKYVLDGQALIKAWRFLCPQAHQTAVLINFAPTGALLALAQPDGPDTHQLVNQTTLDVSLNDLNQPDQTAQTNRRRLIVDLLGALKLFDLPSTETPPIFLLADPTPATAELIEALKDQNLNIEAITWMPSNLVVTEDFSHADLFDYLIPLGLALIALDEDTQSLDLFTDLCQPEQEKDKAAQIGSLKKKALIAGALLVGWILIAYLSDIIQLHRLENAWAQTDTEVDAADLLGQNRLRQNLAAQRIDPLELLTKINEARPEGLLVDRITFKRGRRVTLVATTKNTDLVYQFQEALDKQKGITAVKQSATHDKKKGATATYTFDYKNFTAKRGPR